jgi:hypothetical protein
MLGIALLAQITMTAQLAAAPIPAHDGKTIVRLVSRSQDISIVATSGGTRFSASDRAGVILASNLTLDQLKQQHPDIHRQVEPVWCGSDEARIAIGTVAD